MIKRNHKQTYECIDHLKMITREWMHEIKRAEWHRDEVRDGIIEWRSVGQTQDKGGS